MLILNTGDLALKPSTVNLEIFARILFSRIAFKDIFATLEIRDLGMIYVRISVNERVFLPFREGFNFTKLRICKVSRNKTLAKISNFIVLSLELP